MEEKRLGGLEIYKLAVKISNASWEIFKKLPKHHQYHMGSQFLDSCDSIGANIAEGFGRYHYKDSLKFYYNARGSLFESKHWIHLIGTRNLVEKENCMELMNMLEKEGLKLNNFINTLRKKLKEGD